MTFLCQHKNIVVTFLLEFYAGKHIFVIGHWGVCVCSVFCYFKGIKKRYVLFECCIILLFYVRRGTDVKTLNLCTYIICIYVNDIRIDNCFHMFLRGFLFERYYFFLNIVPTNIKENSCSIN